MPEPAQTCALAFLTLLCSRRGVRSYYAIQARFDALGSVATPELGSAELDGGTTFEIVLTTSDFLGARSPAFTISISRNAMPIPNIAIQAPPVLLFAATNRISLEAQARLA